MMMINDDDEVTLWRWFPLPAPPALAFDSTQMYICHSGIHWKASLYIYPDQKHGIYNILYIIYIIYIVDLFDIWYHMLSCFIIVSLYVLINIAFTYILTPFHLFYMCLGATYATYSTHATIQKVNTSDYRYRFLTLGHALLRSGLGTA